MDDKNQYVSSLTVGPSCFIDGRKHARRKQRFTLFNAALGMINCSPNEKTRKNKKSDKHKDDKIIGNKINNGKNTEGWKKLVGSMRPLHMHASQSPSSSPRHSEYSDSALSCPLPITTSSISSTSRYSSSYNNLQELENMGTMSTSVSPTGSSGTMSPNVSPNNLHELASTGSSGTMSPSLTTDNLQEVEGTMSHSASSNNIQEPLNTGTMRLSASSNNLQELPNTAGTTSTSVSTDDNFQEVARTMSHSISANNLADLARASSRNKHSLSSGNLRGLRRKGKMSSSKSTSNIQDLSLEKMRRYKSALNLDDLDLNEEIEVEEDSDDKWLENFGADMLIDVKADQFIKKFYQEMKSQHKGNVHRRH